MKFSIFCYFSNSSPNGTPPTSGQSSPSFSNFQEKRRSNTNMRNPIRQMVNRASNLRCIYIHIFIFFFLKNLNVFFLIASSNLAISSLLNDENVLENEAAIKHLDVMTTDDARLDIKSQVKNFANNFNKKCSNKTVSIDTLIQDYGAFKDTLKKRIQTNSIYRGKRISIKVLILLFFCVR
jgi:hypothetical protein